MHKFPADMDPLAADLIAAISPLIKDSQSEVMAITAEFDLSLSQLRILFVLSNTAGDLAVNELAERVGLSMAAAGRAADALVRSGLLSRREDALDRRIKRIGLTAAGEQAIEQIGAARRLAAERFTKTLTATERADLAGAVATLAALTRDRFAGACASTAHTSTDISA
jgi:DNA-binding MarR family transcriptional regulator